MPLRPLASKSPVLCAFDLALGINKRSKANNPVLWMGLRGTKCFRSEITWKLTPYCVF